MTTNCEIDLTPDCSACASLCCVVFAFDKSESFALDKAAGEVCPNLSPSGRCEIFEARESLGFKGCVTYNCHGAGQRVTQEVFKGLSWKENPALTPRMGQALSVLRRVHEQLALLRAARQLPLTGEEEIVVQDFETDLSPEDPWTETNLDSFPIDDVARRLSIFLRSLSHHVESPASGRT